MRIAVLDVGTNTTRLYIADVQSGEITAEHERISRVTRLGAGVDASGHLAADALEREHAVLGDYRALIDKAGVDRTVAVMTSAVRDAADGSAFAADVSSRYGIEAHVISGDEEARLTYLGATSDHDHEAADQHAGPTLVVDIGGGSTEIVLGRGDHLVFHVSTQAGVVRQADRHITQDPPTDTELEATAQDVRSIINQAVPERWRQGVGRAIAVAGTPTALAAIAQELDPYDPTRVHGYQLTAAERDAVFARLKTMPLTERQQVPGLHPDRANVILPGIVILTELMNLFELDAVEVSEHDILRGAALAYSA